MMYHLIIERTAQSLTGLGIMLAGLSIYALSRLTSGREDSDRIFHG
jgi:hypothetical protein